MVTTTTNLTTRRHLGRNGIKPNLIAVHTMEAPEGPNTAENVANYFKTVNASSHWCHDNNSRVRVVNDQDTAWTLPGANNRSLNLELAGYAKQTAADWADAYSIDLLEGAALSAAEWVIKYGIPIRHLTEAQIAAGLPGFVGHVDVNRVYKQSSHWDPGPGFPWDYFLNRVHAHVQILGGYTPAIPVPPKPTYSNEGFSEAYITARQNEAKQLGYKLDADGKLGPISREVFRSFQSSKGLEADGIPGPKTAAALQAALTATKPKRPDCTPLQRALRTPADNSWGSNTDKHGNALREASGWGGVDFPYGIAFTQTVVGTTPDNSWGPKSVRAHDATTINVQNALKQMGYDAGPSDGKWGPTTEAAYQAARHDCRI